MELSTSIPTPSARPDREMIFKVIPVKYISTIQVRILIGIENAMISVGRQSLRKISRIRMASTAP